MAVPSRYILGLAWLFAGPLLAAEYVSLPGGSWQSVLPAADGSATVRIAPYRLRREPVTNAEFLAFVQAYPQWRRDRIARLFAEERYLAHWQAADRLGPNALPEQPVTLVSWFAARAYCASEGARLPTWYEWEFAAAADATRPDARGDPAWRARILAWYAHPWNAPLATIGGEPNFYGVRDLHGLIWEWVDDFDSLLIAGDRRDQDALDRLRFCGAGALDLRDTENYAVLMRVAMLRSLKAADTTRNLGFRCALPSTTETK